MPAAKLLIALHDVTPVHAARLERAERMLERLGVHQVTYLLVPDFHRQGRADLAPGFVEWCRARRPFNVQWFLHGYFHDARIGPAERGHVLTFGERVAASVMTDHE